MTAWNLKISKAWTMCKSDCVEPAITVERASGDRIGLSLKGTVLAEGVVLIIPPLFKEDDDNDPLTSLFKGFNGTDQFQWFDHASGEPVPWVVISEDQEHELENTDVGPISDDPVAWLLGLRALFSREQKGGVRVLKVPEELFAKEARAIFEEFVFINRDLPKDFVLLKAFVEKHSELLSE